MRTGSWIARETGSEGPRHDPYAYTEITVHRADGREVTLHSGLAEWMTYSDGRVERRFDDPIPVLCNKFEAIVGITPEVAEKAWREQRERPIRFHNCKPPSMQWVSGYPGEEFLMCDHCKAILDSTFDRSAIE